MGRNCTLHINSLHLGEKLKYEIVEHYVCQIECSEFFLIDIVNFKQSSGFWLTLMFQPVLQI